ncbi:MAG: metallophosphoesterase [Chloroflexi bacterium]|nr:metallophosphoesterase [Chloroflexota bacterium]
MPLTRRQFVRGTIGALSLCAGGLGYSALVEPRVLSIERVTITLPRLPAALDGLTIVQLSDLHRGPHTDESEIAAAVDAANALAPDLVVLTGDYVPDADAPRYVESCAAQMARLKAGLGVYGVLGNQDDWSDGRLVAAALPSAGVPIMRNTAKAIEHNGARFWLAGADDACKGWLDLDKTLRGIPASEPTILLVHEPDIADYVSRHPVDLQLSGHSHGGQVRVPGVGPLILPFLGTKYTMGLYQVNRLPLYVTRGVGMIAPAVRFNCPPEITHITLRARAA